MTHLIGSNELSRDNQDPASQALSVLRSFCIFFISILHRVRRESGNFLLEESGIWELLLVKKGILGSGMRNPAEGIQNPINNWNLGSRFHWQRIQNPVLGIRNPRRGIQNPRRTWIPLHVAKNQMLWLETLLPGLKELLLSLPRHKRCFGNTHFLVNRRGENKVCLPVF